MFSSYPQLFCKLAEQAALVEEAISLTMRTKVRFDLRFDLRSAFVIKNNCSFEWQLLFYPSPPGVESREFLHPTCDMFLRKGIKGEQEHTNITTLTRAQLDFWMVFSPVHYYDTKHGLFLSYGDSLQGPLFTNEHYSIATSCLILLDPNEVMLARLLQYFWQFTDSKWIDRFVGSVTALNRDYKDRVASAKEKVSDEQ